MDAYFRVNNGRYVKVHIKHEKYIFVLTQNSFSFNLLIPGLIFFFFNVLLYLLPDSFLHLLI